MAYTIGDLVEALKKQPQHALVVPDIDFPIDNPEQVAPYMWEPCNAWVFCGEVPCYEPSTRALPVKHGIAYFCEAHEPLPDR